MVGILITPLDYEVKIDPQFFCSLTCIYNPGNPYNVADAAEGQDKDPPAVLLPAFGLPAFGAGFRLHPQIYHLHPLHPTYRGSDAVAIRAIADGPHVQRDGGTQHHDGHAGHRRENTHRTVQLGARRARATWDQTSSSRRCARSIRTNKHSKKDIHPL